ncbi:hypothetical protein LK07_32805 [Streptomyces pluripotens]|uniref:Acyl carrier protein n=1 Tax=Streptomyces pluripotens TaxID=1355015 RepID=A0A221P7A7_9ACTN|nr:MULTISPECIES: hypothetical protein [Streptomyces]ARP73757.1 hypothetical protein LK06_031605 [Streptomyces pluripotens]ASN28004.1 hypothetical protein LK07_32805 [Streptomyces pluripotens]KIE27917.1 hypothetical protein LK08_05535 [Streptomyces sp. MUSC 125]MCH0559333.1 acyl carrier protein [Streptomyces sp. MUM 16J]
MTPVTRDEIVALLARYGERSPEEVGEHLGSLELTWLLAQLEESRGAELDPADHRIDGIRTVDDAACVLTEVLREAAAP